MVKTEECIYKYTHRTAHNLIQGAARFRQGISKLNKHAAERGHRFKKTQNNKCWK